MVCCDKNDMKSNCFRMDLGFKICALVQEEGPDFLLPMLLFHCDSSGVRNGIFFISGMYNLRIRLIVKQINSHQLRKEKI